MLLVTLVPLLEYVLHIFLCNSALTSVLESLMRKELWCGAMKMYVRLRLATVMSMNVARSYHGVKMTYWQEVAFASPVSRLVIYDIISRGCPFLTLANITR